MHSTLHTGSKISTLCAEEEDLWCYPHLFVSMLHTNELPPCHLLANSMGKLSVRGAFQGQLLNFLLLLKLLLS